MGKTIRISFLCLLFVTISWSMDLATNPAGIVYYGDQLVFKNMMYQAKRWYMCNPNNILSGYDAETTALWDNPEGILDENRYPLVAPYEGKGFAVNVLVEMWKDIFPEGEFTLQFEGTGTVKLAGLHTATVNSTGAKTTYTFSLLKSQIAWGTMGSMQRQPRNKQNLRVAITESEKSDPIKNLYLILPGVGEYDDRYPFTDEFLSKMRCSPYTMIRFMDWAKVNDSFDKDWDDRTRRKTVVQTGGFNGKYPYGVAWEFMIELCNTTKKDLWLCVPAYATPDYWEKLAQLVYEKLEPDRKIWLEYANEVWNGIFIGYQAAVAVGQNHNLSPIDKQWQHNNYGYTYQIVRITETFQRVFGADKHRITPLLSGWANGITWSQMRVDALSDPKVNPNNLQIKKFATTTYFGAPAGTDQLLASGGNWRVHIDMCQSEGLDWISYEGGHGGGMPKSQLNSAYTYTLDKLKDAGLTVYNEFLFSNTWGETTYGALEYFSQPTSEAPKYDAICDFAVANNGFDRSKIDVVSNDITALAPFLKFTSSKANSVSRANAGILESAIFDLKGRLIPMKTVNPLAPSMQLRVITSEQGKEITKSVHRK